MKDHVELYKYVGTLGLATFGGCVTLLGALKEHSWSMLIAAYLALAAAIESVYAVQMIVSERRVPFVDPGLIFGRVGTYAP